MVVLMKKCCFCCRVRTGTHFTGWYTLISTALYLVASLFMYVHTNDIPQWEGRVYIQVSMVMASVLVLVSVLLLVGVNMDKRWLMVPWIIAMVVYILMEVVEGCILRIQGINFGTALNLTYIIFVILSDLYGLLCVLQHYWNLKEEERQYQMYIKELGADKKDILWQHREHCALYVAPESRVQPSASNVNNVSMAQEMTPLPSRHKYQPVKEGDLADDADKDGSSTALVPTTAPTQVTWADDRLGHKEEEKEEEEKEAGHDTAMRGEELERETSDGHCAPYDNSDMKDGEMLASSTLVEYHAPPKEDITSKNDAYTAIRTPIQRHHRLLEATSSVPITSSSSGKKQSDCVPRQNSNPTRLERQRVDSSDCDCDTSEPSLSGYLEKCTSLAANLRHDVSMSSMRSHVALHGRLRHHGRHSHTMTGGQQSIDAVDSEIGGDEVFIPDTEGGAGDTETLL